MIPIQPAAPHLYETAHQIAATFQLPVIDTAPPDLPFILYLTDARLELRDMTSKLGPIYVDFIKGTLGYRRRKGGKEAIAKAIGIKHGAIPTVLDATAGLGRDAFILASLGCHVQMLERSPVVAALLTDGLKRVQAEPKIGTFITEHLQLIHGDAQNWLPQLSLNQQPDVIYLDPMYPHRKKSALVKKEMRLFRAVVGDDWDASALLKMALDNTQQRVVVKRPKLAPVLGDMLPRYCIQGKNTRFDVYFR